MTGAANSLNYLHGNATENVLIGGELTNSLTGRGGSNTLDGRGGVDTADYIETLAPVTIDLMQSKAFHSTGTDILLNIENFRGTNFIDTFTGDNKDNYFLALLGNDTIKGNGGKDWLEGYDGIDTIDGGIGDDKLVGGLGNDILTGGLNNDTFVFNTALSATANVDRITDFSAPNDVIHLENAIFTSLAVGALAAERSTPARPRRRPTIASSTTARLARSCMTPTEALPAAPCNLPPYRPDSP